MDKFEVKMQMHAQSAKEHFISPVIIKREDLYEVKKAKKLTMSFVLAAALVILLVTTVLAATFSWHEKLIEFLKPTEKQMQELDGAVNTPSATITKSGVTITIKQTISDSQGIYVLYEMIVPEWIALNDDVVFEYSYLKFDTEQGFTSGQGEKIIEQKQNKRTALIYCSTDGKIKNQTLRLAFSDLGYYDGNAEDNTFKFHTLIESDWTLEWELDYVDSTKIINVNKKVDINDTNNNTITNVYISPMSVLVNIEGDDLWTAFRPIIKLKNGNEIKIEAVNDFDTSYSFTNLPEKAAFNDDGSVRNYGIYSIGHRFDRITDISEIESIVIGDIVIPVE